MIKEHIYKYIILLQFIIAQTLSNPVQKPDHCGLSGFINMPINSLFHNTVEYKFKYLYTGEKAKHPDRSGQTLSKLHPPAERVFL